jgi:polysaccharide chain length determinant protein (PEP-CTERM system associated)
MSTPQTTKPNVAFLPLSIARTIWKRKSLVFGFWAVLSTATFVIVARLPDVYQAEAVILVDSQKIPDKFVSSTVNADLQDRITNISQQILSSNRLKKLIDDFGLYPAERKKLFEEELLEKMRKDIGIKLEPGYNRTRPGAFRMSFQGPDPTVVTQVANRLADLFIEENLRTREVQAEGTAEFIDSQLKDAKKSLDELEKAVSNYKLQHNGELPEQENSIASTLARLQVELEANRDATNRIQDNKVILDSYLATAETSMAAITAAAAARSNTPSGSPLPAMAGGQIVAPARQSPLEMRQAQLDALRQRYGPAHPEVRRVEAEVAQLQAEAARQEKAPTLSQPKPTVPAAPGASANTGSQPPTVIPVQNMREVLDVTGVNERISNIKAQIALANKDLEFRKSEQARILRDMNAYESRLSRLPIREQEMAEVTRDYEMSKANYKSLLDKKFAAGMATDMEHRQKSERFTLLDAATVPGKPQKPNRPVLDAVGSVFGLALGLFIGFGLEMRRDVLLGEWELPSHVAIIGRLPLIEISSVEPAVSGGSSAPRAKSGVLRRLAIVCSVLIGALGIAAAGWFAVTHR